MALNDQEPNQHQPSMWLWQSRRRVSLFRRRKVQTVRLGGKKPRRRIFGLLRIFRRMRVRWLKLQYVRMLKRLKEHYRNLVKDLVEAGATIETFHQRLFMESTFAIPVGVNLSTYPSRFGSDRPRTIFM
ncbi:uncharacterized protein LOC113851603 [Abrus precatorius]|uniref:Uncharacterized protein LOC113851603 n=1 Tax=Abrus precatorius TaxID=3816 RepID=A0A8B8K2C3_ABRPR|nr:uncharacterized protein LOC113851603 [Abrus precatorius]